MKLGLIGTGKQGQRYLLEKNGGRHIVRSGSRDLDDWEGLDGVIIATHPAGHKQLALKAIERGLSVLCEKPLALNLSDCMEIVDAAQHKNVHLLMAHLDCWAFPWMDPIHYGCVAAITYKEHNRDYSAWLDWGPHALALLDRVQHSCRPLDVSLNQGDETSVRLWSGSRDLIYERGKLPTAGTPMWQAVRDLIDGRGGDYGSTRRIYRALFAE